MIIKFIKESAIIDCSQFIANFIGDKSNSDDLLIVIKKKI